MRTATGLAFLAAGAILAFAVNADIPGFNLAVAGWIFMLTGAAGMFIPARASGWLRRRVILHSPGRLTAAQLERGSDRDRPSRPRWPRRSCVTHRSGPPARAAGGPRGRERRHRGGAGRGRPGAGRGSGRDHPAGAV